MTLLENESLMVRVLEAVRKLRERKGSTSRDVLRFVQRTYGILPRNLTMQVHRALKDAAKSGLLRHTSGRYKLVLNSDSVKPGNNKEDDRKSEGGTTLPDKKKEVNKANPARRTTHCHEYVKRRVHDKQRRIGKRERSRNQRGKGKPRNPASPKRDDNSPKGHRRPIYEKKVNKPAERSQGKERAPGGTERVRAARDEDRTRTGSSRRVGKRGKPKTPDSIKGKPFGRSRKG